MSSSLQLKAIFLPALLALSLTAPAWSQLPGRGLSYGPATALEDTGPAKDLVISDQIPKQGQVVQVTVEASALSSGAGGAALPPLEVLGQKYKLFPAAEEGRSIYRALFAVPVVQKPGPYKIAIGALTGQITVKDAHFQVQRLSLPSSKNNFVTAPGEEEAVEKAKSTLSPERFWSENFVKPSHARTSAPFGIRRIVNGKLLSDYFHSGLDFAGFAGSPIYATAPGTVVLAQGGGVFKLHGNMVAIDHGQGVVSFYIHMQKVLVKTGQVVKAGEQIGLVGQTGRANGPHLHFSIYVNKVASSPLQWFTSAL